MAVDPTGELEQALERVVGGEPFEIREDGRRVTGLDDAQYEVRPGRKPLLYLWSGDRTLARRVTRVVEADGDHVRLDVERFGRTKPGRLEIVRRERARKPSRLNRENFANRLEELLTRQFPDETLESLSTAPDPEHSLSGNYARGWLRRGKQGWAVLSAAPGETAATMDGSLTYGLLWLDRLRARNVAPIVAGLRLILPAGAGRITTHRLAGVAPDLAVELYEWQMDEPLARRMDGSAGGNIATWLVPRRQTEFLLEQVKEIDARIRSLSPDAIDSAVVPGTRQVSWRYHGLEFARWSRGTLRVGLGPHRAEVAGDRWSDLERLVAELSAHRCADGDHRHPLFRASRERWLETMVLADPARIDARLDANLVYSQVPAFSASDRGVLDLLGVNAEGRLAVIELKADENLQLIFQAVDYWLRVRWHQQQGDFERYGYFPGRTLHPGAPLLYLVAPGLRFHSALRTLARYLSPEIPVCRVGLNEDWRRGLRVIEREWRASPAKAGIG